MQHVLSLECLDYAVVWYGLLDDVMLSSNRVMIQAVTLSQTVQCVTGKSAAASHWNRLRWRIESCQGSSSEARDAVDVC